jgi:RNA polymerase sigma-70 factor (ECF subfamily)
MSEARELFEVVFEEHFDVVLRFASARAEAEAAKDVASETFLAAWRAFDDLPSQPRGWLLAVCRRKLADHYRAAGRQGNLAEVLATSPMLNQPDHGDAVVERDLVGAAFARLRPADQELLRLLAWDGLTHLEAAEVLGCRPAAFSVRLHRARRRLREALAAGEPSPEAPPIADIAPLAAAGETSC